MKAAGLPHATAKLARLPVSGQPLQTARGVDGFLQVAL